MSFFNKYPYSDIHELNLDWLLAKMKELNIAFEEFKVVNNITFSGQWDITKQYPAWTIVSDNNIGYVSIQPVPIGVVLTNTDYWVEVIDYTAQIAGLQTRVVALENTVGDASSGLVHDTAENTSDISALDVRVGKIEDRDYFKNKDILILGDSLSDESIARFQPNWVTYFRTQVTAAGGTITNYSVSGRTLSSVDANNLIDDLANVPAGAYTDIILFLGVNDWQLNATPSQFNTAIGAFNTWVQANYSTANVHIITPLKSVTTLGATQPLMFFRLYLIKMFTNMGFNIIDAFADAPFFNGYNAFLKDKWSGDNLGTHDGLHINPDYAPYFAEFVYRKMQTFSTGSLSGHVSSVIHTSFYNGSNLELYLHEDGKVALHLDLGSYTPGSTQTLIGSLPTWAAPIISQSATIFTGAGTSCQLIVQSGGAIYLITPNLSNMPFCNLYMTFYPDPFERTSDNITI